MNRIILQPTYQHSSDIEILIKINCCIYQSDNETSHVFYGLSKTVVNYKPNYFRLTSYWTRGLEDKKKLLKVYLVTIQL